MSEKPYFAPHVMLCYAAETENNRSTRPSVSGGMQWRTLLELGGIVCVRPAEEGRTEFLLDLYVPRVPAIMYM